MEIPSTPVQIASGYTAGPNPASIVTGPAGLAYDSKTDTLYVAGEGDDEIFAVENASTTTSDNGTGTVVYNDPAHLYGPLGLILAPNGDLLTANADSINAQPTFASQIVEFTPSPASGQNPAGTFVMSLQVDPLNGGSFGLRLMENNGIAKLLAVDDNTVTLNAYNFALMQNPF
jgi:DNA-binding beta-propeller fold protein YncE